MDFEERLARIVERHEALAAYTETASREWNVRAREFDKRLRATNKGLRELAATVNALAANTAAVAATVDRVVTRHDVLGFRLEVLTERVDKMAAKIDKLVDVVASHEHRLEQIRTETYSDFLRSIKAGSPNSSAHLLPQTYSLRSSSTRNSSTTSRGLGNTFDGRSGEPPYVR